VKPEQAQALREEFPPEQVGKLPKAGVELDYVGHGAVTHRLLDVDPEWNWEPVAWDEYGEPRFVRTSDGHPIRLWIKLTVAGVTRLGVGSCMPKQFDAEKVLIGDAIRNAAMRFGVALDLWIRGHAEDDEKVSANDTRQAPERAKTVPAATKVQRKDIEEHVALLTADELVTLEEWAAQEGIAAGKETRDQAKQVLAWLEQTLASRAPEVVEQPTLGDAS
jgi:hypothetical protein